MKLTRLARISRLGLYVSAVSVGGLILLILLASGFGLVDISHARAEVWMFFAFAVLGELLPIRVPRGDEREEITTSTTFVLATLLVAGIVPAVLTQAIALFVGDLAGRKPLWKAGFNVAQTGIALFAAGTVLTFLTAVPRMDAAAHLRPSEVPAILLAAAVYFLVNHVLTGIALALAQGLPVLPYLRSDFVFQAATAGVMTALSVGVVIVADFSPFLIPVLAVPLVPVYKSVSASLENARLVTRLEQSLDRLRVQADKNRHQALHDALTDLPNRSHFHDQVKQALEVMQGRTAAVLIMDVNHFKEINDTLGHHNGDQLLQQIGTRLRGMLREGDTIARLGGDEFGVLALSLPGPVSAVRLAKGILRGLEEPFVVGGLALDVSASIGISLFPDHGEDVDTLIRRADVAMYVAKETPAGYEIYAPHQERYSPGRLALAGELRRALDRKELVLHYQPIADLRTGDITSVEALVRWQHPEHGLLFPDGFLSLAEHTALIRPLTSYVLDAALAQCCALEEAGLHLPVAINLSARSLSDVQLPDDVWAALRQLDLSPQALKLEITETSIMSDPARALEILTRLSALGVMISLDDFGTGYSSLAFLKQLPVGEIKIDMSFVQNMMRNEDDAVIVRSTIDLGRNLGLRVVAEGVESEAIWSRLAALGCDLAQGHFVGRAIPSDELVTRLANLPKRPRDESSLRIEPRTRLPA